MDTLAKGVICNKCNLHLRLNTFDYVNTRGEKCLGRSLTCPRCGASKSKIQDTNQIHQR